MRFGAVLVLGLVTLLPAQDWYLSQATVPDDPVVAQGLLKAQEFLERKDVRAALQQWQQLIDKLGGRVIQTATGPRDERSTDPVVPGDRFRSVRAHVLELLRARPAEDLALYTEMQEPAARAALAEGASQLALGPLREAARRWILTPSGRSAALTLIDILLEEGRFSEALDAARRTTADFEIVGAAPQERLLVRAREALALHGLGRAAELSELARTFEREPRPSLRVGKETRPAAEWFTELANSVHPTPEVARMEPPLAAAARLRVWADSFERNADARELFVLEGREVNARVGAFPVLPVVHAGSLFWNDGLHLVARGLTARTALWPPVSGPVSQFAGRRNRNMQFRVLADDDLLVASLEGAPSSKRQRSWQGFDTIESIPSRKLVAVDAATGRVRWSHHAPAAGSTADKEFLRRLSVAHPPVAQGNTLYCTGTSLLGVFHHWALALDRDTGAILWRTWLGAGQLELNMFGNPVKEAVPLPLALADGVLYGSTCMGVAFAVDASSGTIAWESAYEQEPMPGTDSPITYERHPGWLPEAAAVHGEDVFMAPTDSPVVIACNKRDGTVREITATRRTLSSLNTWFLGIHAGQLLVAGQVLAAITPETGALRWRSVDLPARGARSVIEGRPAVHGKIVVVPVEDPRSRGSALHVHDLEGGALLARHEAKDRGLVGNVVLADETLVIAGEETISVHFDREEVEARLLRAVRAGSATPAQHLRLGELEMRRPDFVGAIASFERSLNGSETAADANGIALAHRALVEAWLAAARAAAADIPEGVSREACHERALAHANSAEDRARVLGSALEGAVAAKSWQQALARAESLRALGDAVSITPETALQSLLGKNAPDEPAPAALLAGLVSAEIATAQGDAPTALQRWQSLRSTQGRRILNGEPLQQVAARRIRELLTTCGPEAYAQLEKEARAAFTAAVGTADEAAIRRVLEEWPEAAVASEARDALIDLLVKNGKAGAAVLENERRFIANSSAVATARLRHAELLRSAGLKDSAREVAESIQLRGEGTDAVAAFLAQLGPAEVPVAAPADQLAPAWRIGREDADSPAQLIVTNGHALPTGLVLAFVDGQLSAVDAAKGTVLWSRPVTSLDSAAHVADGRVLLHHDGVLACVDLANGATQWECSQERFQFLGAGVALGVVHVLARSDDRAAALRLLALDWCSGTELLNLAVGQTEQGMLQFNAGFVLVQAAGAAHSNVLDGLTLAAVAEVPPLEALQSAAFLTKSGLVVLHKGGPAQPDRRSNAEHIFTAFDPHTKSERWRHVAGTGMCMTTGSDGRHLVYQMTERDGRNRRMTVLELERGTTAATCPLGNDATSAQPLIVGNRLFQSLRSAPRPGTGGGFTERVKVLDLAHGNSPWSSADFTGTNLNLRIVAAGARVLIRRSTNSRGTRVPSSTLYALDAETGSVTGTTELGPHPNYTNDAGMQMAAGTLVTAVGRELIGWRSPAK